MGRHLNEENELHRAPRADPNERGWKDTSCHRIVEGQIEDRKRVEDCVMHTSFPFIITILSLDRDPANEKKTSVGSIHPYSWKRISLRSHPTNLVKSEYVPPLRSKNPLAGVIHPENFLSSIIFFSAPVADAAAKSGDT